MRDVRGCGSDVNSLRGLSPRDFDKGGPITRDEFDTIFRVCDALWLHSGDPRAPHAELTSGSCSDGFVDVLRVLRFTNLCEVLANQLADKIAETGGHQPEWVIGSDHAGATFSFTVAMQFNAQHDFTEKGPDKTQLWKRFTIQPEETVLQVEELITTTQTLKAVRHGIRTAHRHDLQFLPVIGTLVHRSDAYQFEGAQIVYLRHYDIKTWLPEECPLCARGSKRLKPKHNWDELTRYSAL